MSAPIPAESAPPTKENIEKRALVLKLLQNQNKTVVDFAKHVVTVCFAAVGVTLTLQEKWLVGVHAHAKLVLGIAVALFLAAALVASAAVVAYKLRVSLSDYEQVDSELTRVMQIRLRITLAAMGMATLAATLTAAVALRAAV